MRVTEDSGPASRTVVADQAPVSAPDTERQPKVATLANPVLQAVVSGGATNPGFVASVTAIQAYSTYLAGLQLTSDATLNSTLTTAKTDAAQWYDSIYPTYLDMPATISSQSPTVDAGLTALVQLAGQYQSTPTAAILAGITEQAATLLQTVGSLASQAGSLTTQLTSFATSLQSDLGALNSAAGQVAVVVSGLQQQVTGLYGQLQHLRSAACPSKSAIQACEQTISVTQQQLQDAESAQSVASTAAQESGTAGSGLGYLAGYWGAVAQDAQACVSALAAIQSDPATVIQTDLQHTQQLWAELEQQFQELGAQIAAL